MADKIRDNVQRVIKKIPPGTPQEVSMKQEISSSGWQVDGLGWFDIGQMIIARASTRKMMNRDLSTTLLRGYSELILSGGMAGSR